MVNPCFFERMLFLPDDHSDLLADILADLADFRCSRHEHSTPAHLNTPAVRGAASNHL